MVDGNFIPNVIRKHLIVTVVDIGGVVSKVLLIGDHPVSIQKEKNWSPSQDFDSVHGELVVKRWWQLVVVSDFVSLAEPDEDQREKCNWEKDWHSNTVEHGDENDVKDTRVLEVDDVSWSTIQINIALHTGLLGLVNVIGHASVHLSEEPLLHPSNWHHHWCHNHVKTHGINHQVTDVIKPEWRVVVVVAVEQASEELTLLSEVGEHKKWHEGCIKELSNEHPVSNVHHLLRLSIVSNPLDVVDGDCLQNTIDNNKNKRNRRAHSQGDVVIFKVHVTLVIKSSSDIGGSIAVAVSISTLEVSSVARATIDVLIILSLGLIVKI